MKKTTKKPKKVQDPKKPLRPKVYQVLNSEIKYKKEKLTCTVDAGLTENVQNLIKAYKKINGNMFSNLNLSKIVNESLKAVNLETLQKYDKKNV